MAYSDPEELAGPTVGAHSNSEPEARSLYPVEHIGPGLQRTDNRAAITSAGRQTAMHPDGAGVAYDCKQQ